MNPFLHLWHTQLHLGQHTVWPDGCRDVILVASENAPIQLVYSGLELQARRLHCANQTKFFGIRLRAGAQFSPEQSGANPHQDLDVSVFFKTAFHSFCDMSSDEVMRALKQVLENHVRPPPPWFTHFLEDISYERPLYSGIKSERSFRRQVVALSGAPPQYWRSLLRVRRAGQMVALNSEVPLLEIALACGYSDQAHMNRDMQRWFASTPGQVRRQTDVIHAHFSTPTAFT